MMLIHCFVKIISSFIPQLYTLAPGVLLIAEVEVCVDIPKDISHE